MANKPKTKAVLTLKDVYDDAGVQLGVEIEVSFYPQIPCTDRADNGPLSHRMVITCAKAVTKNLEDTRGGKTTVLDGPDIRAN